MTGDRPVVIGIGSDPVQGSCTPVAALAGERSRRGVRDADAQQRFDPPLAEY